MGRGVDVTLPRWFVVEVTMDTWFESAMKEVVVDAVARRRHASRMICGLGIMVLGC